jgi:hypothetical protein
MYRGGSCLAQALGITGSEFRPIGVIGEGLFPLTFVGSIALLLFLLRYVSLVLSDRRQKKEGGIYGQNINCSCSHLL